jgi:uncharacterized protein (DUF2267 family)
MEESLSEDSIQEMLEELEEEQQSGQESLSSDVEELLRKLQSGSFYHSRREAAEQLDLADTGVVQALKVATKSVSTRREAAEKLGKVDTSSPRIVQALVVARKSDSHTVVRDAAAKALRASVHQEYLQRLRDRMEETERDLFRVKRGDYQRVATSDSKILQGFLNFILGGPTRFD